MSTIIVLDDVMDASVMVKRILERKGHTVHPFTEEEDALAFVRDNEAALAILDIKLKKMSGVQVLEELKKINPDLKVIMLTGYPTLETARESQRLGADEYCVKPIDKDELEEKVTQVLGQRPRLSSRRPFLPGPGPASSPMACSNRATTCSSPCSAVSAGRAAALDSPPACSWAAAAFRAGCCAARTRSLAPPSPSAWIFP